MAFIGFILLLCFLYWIFSSKDKLGDIDKANKVLEKFNSDLEKQIEKNDSKTSTVKNTTASKTINIPSDLLKSIRESQKTVDQQVEELGIAIDVDGRMFFDIDLNSVVFEEKIINFILVRYYLTGLKSFPDFVGFKNYLLCTRQK